jgi:phosphoribosyl 1,2-cyclic phosphate phosphodiesterase
MSEIKVRILGCGSSGGVPRIGNRWGDCDPEEPKNNRSRCSILVTKGKPGSPGQTQFLVDTSPDMRAQLLAANCRSLDAVLYTHDHADQTHGLDDLRQICYMMRRRIPVYMEPVTRNTLRQRFGYAFEQLPGSAYPAILEAREMPQYGETFQIDGEGGSVPVVPFCLEHGPTVQSLGFRIGSLGYTPDVSNIPDQSIEVLQGLDVWIIDALRRTFHPTHFHLDLALEWIERLQPKRAILTNMHLDMDYQTLCRELPENVIPAYDGLEVMAKI